MADGDTVLRDANQSFAAALFAELARAGVMHVCLCPGSRSTPLAVAAARTRGLLLHPLLDERAAGFFALGLARASRQPVALVCTSGTAAANFLPAVVEAHYARVPLLVLTADRPPELREWGAGQTIDQIRLYGAHVRLFVEAPVPGPGRALDAYVRMLARRAAATTIATPPGPVHLNLPFREPLEPSQPPSTVPVMHDRDRHADLDLRVTRAVATPAAERVARVAARLATFARGVIVAGPMDRDPAFPAAVSRLARVLGWPLLAEPTSQLRSGAHVAEAPVVAHHDAFLRDAAFAGAHRPDAVLRFGDTPTSKPLRQWLESDAEASVFLVDPDGAWHQPSHRAGELLQVDDALLCEGLVAALAGIDTKVRMTGWTDAFLDADRVCAQTFDEALGREPRLLAPAVVRALARSLPDGATLFVSNSMPVRDVDTFWPVQTRPLRVLCNRGANGIDGILSTGLGASVASEGPTLILTGDLAFLHDVGGLFAAREVRSSCTIVAINDDGGGIFSFLPIAEQGDSVRFRELFTLAHGLTLGHAAALYGLGYERVVDLPALRRSLACSMGTPGVRVIEVPMASAANVAHHRALWSAVSVALEAGRHTS